MSDREEALADHSVRLEAEILRLRQELEAARVAVRLADEVHDTVPECMSPHEWGSLWKIYDTARAKMKEIEEK